MFQMMEHKIKLKDASVLSPNCQPGGWFKEHREGKERNEKRKEQGECIRESEITSATKAGQEPSTSVHRVKFSAPVQENLDN